VDDSRPGRARRPILALTSELFVVLVMMVITIFFIFFASGQALCCS